METGAPNPFSFLTASEIHLDIKTIEKFSDEFYAKLATSMLCRAKMWCALLVIQC